MQCWLEELGLSEYKKILTKAGFINLKACKQLSASSLDDIGVVLPGHKLRLLSAGIMSCLNYQSWNKSY